MILSLLSTATEVARYGLAYQAAFTLSVMGNFFRALRSRPCRICTQPTARGSDGSSSGPWAHVVGGVPIAVVGFFVGPEIIAFFGTKEFLDKSNLVLPLLLVCVGLTFLTGTVSQALFAAHHQVFLMRLNLFNLVANIALNIALIPHLGSLGAAIALIVSEVVGLVVANFRLASRTPYRTPWLFPPSSGAADAGSRGCTAARRSVDASVACRRAGGVVYVVVNLVSGPRCTCGMSARYSAGTARSKPMERRMGRNRNKELDRAYLPAPSNGVVTGGVAVLIVAYRSPELLADCLNSCRRHLADLSVHVWDNSGPAFPGMDEVRSAHPE